MVKYGTEIVNPGVIIWVMSFTENFQSSLLTGCLCKSETLNIYSVSRTTLIGNTEKYLQVARWTIVLTELTRSKQDGCSRRVSSWGRCWRCECQWNAWTPQGLAWCAEESSASTCSTTPHLAHRWLPCHLICKKMEEITNWDTDYGASYFINPSGATISTTSDRCAEICCYFTWFNLF